jgi:hypothetical protein
MDSSSFLGTRCIIYQGTDILLEIFSSSPDTRVFVARKLHEGASPRVILSDKHECWTARKNFWRYTVCPRIEFTRGKTFLFLILRKNFRGITFFASSETPISVIKKSFSTQRKT